MSEYRWDQLARIFSLECTSRSETSRFYNSKTQLWIFSRATVFSRAMLCLCPETGIYVIFYTSASNVISSSPPTRPFHWGLIKCIADTPEETRTGEHSSSFDRGGPMKSVVERVEVVSVAHAFQYETQIFQNSSISLFPSLLLPLSLFFLFLLTVFVSCNV